VTSGPAGGLWRGLSVAITTPFDAELGIDREALERHARWLVDHGVERIVAAGSLGEGASLTAEERIAVTRTLVAAVGPSVPIISAIGAAATRDAVSLARAAADAGARGLLVLPPYVYRGDRREITEHFHAVFRATDLPCMLYNNPGAYGVDVGPETILDLAEEHPGFTGVKESSGDVRRLSAIRALLGERLDLAVGLDDAVVEGVASGALGWISGLANALPEESRALFDAALGADRGRAFEIYGWFLPLLRMDTEPKFVQLIKSVEAELGGGPARVRPPRLGLDDAETARVRAVVREALARRPTGLPASPAPPPRS